MRVSEKLIKFLYKMMSEDNRLSVSLGEEREGKRKLDDFSSLYGLEHGTGGPAAPRSLPDNQGTYGGFILVIT